jgi:hypothetical protein
MTPALKVRAKYPKAYAYQFAGASPWVIYSGGIEVRRGKRATTYNFSLNSCDPTRRQAWASAAKHLRRVGGWNQP